MQRQQWWKRWQSKARKVQLYPCAVFNQWYDIIHAKNTGDNGRLTDCMKTSNYVR